MSSSKIALAAGLRVAMRRGRRSIATATVPLLEKKLMKVPTMGDSITEGTIVEWTAQIGQGVKDGDVVALVETDKVTVEIKAETDGVITQQFGAIDDTVEVGAKLYELDTEATPTVEAGSTSSSAAESSSSSLPPEKAASEPAPAQSAESAPITTTSSQQSRSPSIKFLGKTGWQAVKSGKKPESVGASAAPKGPLDVTVIRDDKIIHPMYGRPKFTEEEMEALIMGGASIAPMVVAHSKGAKFQY